MLLFVFNLAKITYNLLMIRKNINKNVSSDFGKTDFGNLTNFFFITFALGLKKLILLS